MKFEIRINGMARTVELTREDQGWRILLDGEVVDADAREIAPNVFSILLDGESEPFEATSCRVVFGGPRRRGG